MGFAHELRRFAEEEELPFEAEVMGLDEYKDYNNLHKDGLIVLVTACFGTGEPTDNAKGFYKWLMDQQREQDGKDWQKMHYALFGLGQKKHYPERYQQVSKEIEARLDALGAQKVVERGEGDDSEDIEGDFETWSQQLYATLADLRKADPDKFSAIMTATAGQAAPPAAEPAVAKPAADRPRSCADLPAAEPAQPAYNVRNPFKAPILAVRELAASDARPTRHLELDLAGSGLTYKTGDYLGVFADNQSDMVAAVAKQLRVDLHEVIDVRDHPLLAVDRSLPDSGRHLSLYTVLTRHCDLMSPPRRSVLRSLAAFASGRDKDKLQFLASDSALGKADYQSYVVNDRRTFLEILQAFPSIRIPKRTSTVVDLLPPLQNRFYSLCSSSLISPERAEIVAGLVKFQAPTGRLHRGQCSTYLHQKTVGDRLPVFVKESLFRLPEQPEVPIVMVGAGTGIAPFRAFLLERVALLERGHQVGPSTLIFGCNDREKDFLYGDELIALQRRHPGHVRLEVAPSHEQAYRIFVQHRLLEPELAEHVVKTLLNGGNLYICGDAQRMAPAVHEALVLACERFAGMNRPDAETYLANLKATMKYQLDCF